MAQKNLACAILIVSDTADYKSNRAGTKIQALVEEHGHSVQFFQTSEKRRNDIKDSIKTILSDRSIELIIICGGCESGVRDVTPEAASYFLRRRFAGFGELLRSALLETMGAHSMFVRAAAGRTRRGTFLFAFPSSDESIEAATNLIFPIFQKSEESIIVKKEDRGD